MSRYVLLLWGWRKNCSSSFTSWRWTIEVRNMLTYWMLWIRKINHQILCILLDYRYSVCVISGVAKIIIIVTVGSLLIRDRRYQCRILSEIQHPFSGGGVASIITPLLWDRLSSGASYCVSAGSLLDEYCKDRLSFFGLSFIARADAAPRPYKPNAVSPLPSHTTSFFSEVT